MQIWSCSHDGGQFAVDRTKDSPTSVTSWGTDSLNPKYIFPCPLNRRISWGKKEKKKIKLPLPTEGKASGDD